MLVLGAFMGLHGLPGASTAYEAFRGLVILGVGLFLTLRLFDGVIGRAPRDSSLRLDFRFLGRTAVVEGVEEFLKNFT